MAAITLCPTCHQLLTIVGTFQICPVHGQISLEAQPHAPLRIFLSYGHDHNEELVRLIKADLEKRGHDVWFDKNEIKFGDDWRREITDGIMGSNRVLSFLSKHSTDYSGIVIYRGNVSEAENCATTSISIWKKLENKVDYRMGKAFWVLGLVEIDRNNHSMARQHLTEALRLLRLGLKEDHLWVCSVEKELEKLQ